jgi:Ser/Thr protein kinase RdoA (MazF antagonist)
MQPHPYDALTPDAVLGAVEVAGYVPDGRLLALNSYENRVYQVGLDNAAPIIAKFYRPDRLVTAAILEEHAFALELAANEVPVVPPIVCNGQTLLVHEGFRYALFERHGGRWPELNSRDDREWLGRFLGRLHQVGGRGWFVHRPRLTVERLGDESRSYLLSNDWIPDHIVAAYESVSAELLDAVQTQFDLIAPLRELRLHGDCHPGNVLWTDNGPHFVDLDDCMQGPAIQDLWMLLSGSRQEMSVQLSDLLRGYGQFAELDFGELRLIEPLRSLRIMNYAAWLARRYEDPAFPRAFPWFSEPRYWEQHVLNLREQLAALQEEPLVVE